MAMLRSMGSGGRGAAAAKRLLANGDPEPANPSTSAAAFSRAQARCRRKSPPEIGLVATAPGLRGHRVAT